VPTEPATTVLDALRSIRWHTDPTLTMRHSCCHSSCGACGVRVNGAEVLGCVTSLTDLPDGVTPSQLRGQRFRRLSRDVVSGLHRPLPALTMESSAIGAGCVVAP